MIKVHHHVQTSLEHGENNMLEINSVHVSMEDKKILTGLSLAVKPGEIHAIMGPNGSGKSTLASVIAGHPRYTVEQGHLVFRGKDLKNMSPALRAQEGLFLAFQYPVEIPGVTLRHFLYTISKQKHPSVTPMQFRDVLQKHLTTLGIDQGFLDRQLNVGFSGGEKKRVEVLQLLLLQPTFAVLDETDSGLDVDSLKIVAQAMKTLRGPEFSALIITHYPHLLSLLQPDRVHVMAHGKIIVSGDMELVQDIEQQGYQKWVSAHE